MAKCIIITGCVDCPYRTGYYFARCVLTDVRLDDVKLNEWEYKKPDYPKCCPLKEIEP
ncbi:MAG: hypothetical protein PHV87_07985 [Bacilli bacterium]|nr:hypothetical protein [Bacilli bacterium]